MNKKKKSPKSPPRDSKKIVLKPNGSEFESLYSHSNVSKKIKF